MIKRLAGITLLAFIIGCATPIDIRGENPTSDLTPTIQDIICKSVNSWAKESAKNRQNIIDQGSYKLKSDYEVDTCKYLEVINRGVGIVTFELKSEEGEIVHNTGLILELGWVEEAGAWVIIDIKELYAVGKQTEKSKKQRDDITNSI